MYRFYKLRLLTLACLIVGAAIVLSFASLGPASHVDLSPQARPIYDPDPAHLWNRLHEALFVRVGPDGRTYGQDRLEPLLWGSSKHLLEGPSNRRAVAVLEEFLKSRGERRIDDPLKRAVLERDLWLVFNWLEGNHFHFFEPVLKPDEVRAAQDRLRRPLAAVIGQLALTPEQVARLPDNYAAAVAAGIFPKRFDPDHPDRPFLPPDLFAADGPWVCVGRPDGPDAPTHLADTGTNPFTNSAFLVFLRLPAGRAATVEYLKRLRSFDGPPMVKAKDARDFPNPKLPPLPVGTAMALVRRALLITSAHRPTASPLTESVQLRVYRQVPEPSVANLTAALNDGTAANRRARSWQAFHEFRLSRSLLFAGRAGGLRAVGPEERDFLIPFVGWYQDEFEDPEAGQADRRFPGWAQVAVMQECFQCHSLPGVASFNSYFNTRIHLNDAGAGARPFPLREMPVSAVAGAAVRWKEGRPSWAALRKLLEE